MSDFKGRLVTSKETHIAVVVSRFNEIITDSLLKGCLEGLSEVGIPKENVVVAHVPGAMEIPLVASRLAHSRRFGAIITLGCIVRGATSHFDFVAGPVSSALSCLSIEANLPVIFGVLTTDTIEQAFERAGSKAGNKGYEAALSAVQMLDLLRHVDEACPCPDLSHN